MSKRNLIFLYLIFMTTTILCSQEVRRINQSSLSVTSNSPVCRGAEILLSVTGAESYEWSGPSAFVSQDSVITLAKASPMMAGTYQVVGKNGDVFDTLLVDVTVLDRPSFKVQTPSKICVGDTANLKASNGMDWTWQTNNGQILGNGPEVFLSNMLVGSTSIKLAGLDTNNCLGDTTFTIAILPKPILKIKPDIDTVCELDLINLEITTDIGSVYLQRGRLASPFVQVQFQESAFFTVEAISDGCITEVKKFIIAIPKPVIELTPDTTIKLGSSLLLEAKSEGVITWRPGKNLSCIQCTQTIATPDDITRYCATADNLGCKSESCMIIDVEDFCHPTMPNILSLSSPNNHAFCMPINSCLRDASLFIYDRWGNLIYQGRGRGACWEANATHLHQVYTYLIKTNKAIEGERNFRGTVWVGQ